MEFHCIVKVISEQMNIGKEKITIGTSFSDDLGADSLDIFLIMTEIEGYFGISDSDASAVDIITVNDALMHIKNATK